MKSRSSIFFLRSVKPTMDNGKLKQYRTFPGPFSLLNPHFTHSCRPVMMNRSSLFRLIKPTASSSFGDIRKLKRQYLTVPGPGVGVGLGPEPCNDFPRPFSLLNPDIIQGLDGSWTNYKQNSCQVLGPGIILLKHYITVRGQAGIVNICEKRGGFYEPCNRYGHNLRFRMTCFGRNWEPLTRYGRHCTPYGSEPPPLPYEFIHLAKTAIEDAQAHLDELPTMCPDVCVAKFYCFRGRHGLHQDRDESFDSLTKGLPVVSISAGDNAEFWYGYTRDAKQLNKVLLESGDVLIFGGKSRLIFHGLKKIIPTSFSRPLTRATRMKGGHLNLTLKQF